MILLEYKNTFSSILDICAILGFLDIAYIMTLLVFMFKIGTK